MKIILAVMGAVIVILVVALGAVLMDKPDVAVREVPTNENRQGQSQNQKEIERLRRDMDRMQSDHEAEKKASKRECMMEGRIWSKRQDKCLEN